MSWSRILQVRWYGQSRHNPRVKWPQNLPNMPKNLQSSNVLQTTSSDAQILNSFLGKPTDCISLSWLSRKTKATIQVHSQCSDVAGDHSAHEMNCYSPTELQAHNTDIIQVHWLINNARRLCHGVLRCFCIQWCQPRPLILSLIQLFTKS